MAASVLITLYQVFHVKVQVVLCVCVYVCVCVNVFLISLKKLSTDRLNNLPKLYSLQIRDEYFNILSA
jgi:hypothetical protein